MARWTSSVPTRNELRDAKRDAVLREASTSFNKRGYHGTSLEDIAQKLGVTKAALYYYFANKQAVLKACFDLAMEKAFENLARAQKDGRTGREKLKIVLTGFVEYLIDEAGVSISMMAEDSLSPADMVSVKAERARFESALRELVREGVKDGSIVPCDPKLVIMALLGALNWVPNWFKPEGEWSRAQVAEFMTDMLERMISTQPAATLPIPPETRRLRKAEAADAA